QPRERDTRQERLERTPLRRLPGRGERAERPPVERPFERDDSRLARRLARVLQRGLDRLGARVAEERLRAAEALREPLGERRHRLAPVQVRDVPDALELLARGGGGGRMDMPEPDYGDPAAAIGGAAPVGAVRPGALSLA